MKDCLHPFGGMSAGIALLAACISGWSAPMRCHGAEVGRVAPDGANTILHVPPKYIPQSGDKVVVDDFEYIMVSVSDWTRWTNAVARLEAVAGRRWENEHKTDAGRRAWHGDLKERRQTEDGRGMVYTYADGYTYTEQAGASRRVSPAVERVKKAAAKPQGASAAKPRGSTPPRLRAKREAISARPAAKEVNATFGPGGKLINVEGGK